MRMRSASSGAAEGIFNWRGGGGGGGKAMMWAWYLTVAHAQMNGSLISYCNGHTDS